MPPTENKIPDGAEPRSLKSKKEPTAIAAKLSDDRPTSLPFQYQCLTSSTEISQAKYEHQDSTSKRRNEA